MLRRKPMPMTPSDTIAAIATPPGQGGVGIVRLSGPLSRIIGEQITGQTLTPRYALYGSFRDNHGALLDQGITLFFPNPNSFTGEDVLELQAHGGPVVLDLLLQATLSMGARMARPGEFSERAFLNDKLDLAQAEAIADLISASSEQAARSAVRTLEGTFSKTIDALTQSCIALRVYVEAAIDFPDEEIDFLSDGHVSSALEALKTQLSATLSAAEQGVLLQEGMTLVIAGRPNAGKSSLLNALSGQETAIVTEYAGTTRDILQATIQLDGLPLQIIDTAGLRETSDPVEQVGIERALKAIAKADLLLWMIDSSLDNNDRTDIDFLAQQAPEALQLPQLTVYNKCDISGQMPGFSIEEENAVVISAHTGAGLTELRTYLKEKVGFAGAQEGQITARRRHLDALRRAQDHLLQAEQQLHHNVAGELVAEDLRACQNALSEITGTFTSDDLLGQIFSSFCIGK